MAAMDAGHKPPSGQASLQRMLDLEKKYKVSPPSRSGVGAVRPSLTTSWKQLARLHSTNTSPSEESVASFPAPPRPPLQARRRDSKESLAKKESDPMLRSPRRAVPPPDLSISIPPAEGDIRREDDIAETTEDTSRRRHEGYSDDEDDGGSTPRERTVTFLAMDDDDDDDDDVGQEEEEEESDDDFDRKSEHSSICQSPSWAGYGEKKKKKKLEAEKKRKAKELAEQEKAAKKKAGRFLKSPPLPDTASADRSLAPPNPRRPTSKSSAQSYVPPWAGIAIGAGGYIPGLTQNYKPNKAGTAPASPRLDQDRPPVPNKTSLDNVSSTLPKQVNSATAHEVYKKLVDSQNAIKALPDAPKSKNVRSTFYKAHSMLGEHYSHGTPAKSPRGLSAGDSTTNGVSYPPQSSKSRALRHTAGNGHLRTNSAAAATALQLDESSKFFKAEHLRSTQNARQNSTSSTSDESANSAPNERGRPRAETTSYVRQARAQSAERSLSRYMDEVAVSNLPLAAGPRPGSSRSRTVPPSLKANGEALDVTDAPPSPKRPVTRGKEGAEPHTDYFNFVTKPYAPPALELPAPGGLLSSLRSKLSRRSSAGSTAQDSLHASSAANPSASAKASMDSANPARSLAPSTAKSVSSSPQQTSEGFARLPKAARVLGEFNAVTMQTGSQPHAHPGSRPSEGSSTSSYHDDSSGPPSPASTPDTSRPQSARGLSAAIEEVQKAGNRMFLPSAEELAVGQQKQQAAGTASGSTRSSSSSSRTQQGNASQGETRPGSKGRLLESDRPWSKGRPLEDLVRQTTKPRSLDDIERPGSKGRHFEGTEGLRSRGNSSGSKGDAGLGEDNWSRTALPIDIDTDSQSFVTSLTHLETVKSSSSLVPPHPIAEGSKTETGGHDHSRPSSRHSRRSDDGREKERDRSRSSRRKDKKSNSHSKQMSVVNEEPKSAVEPTAPPLIHPEPIRPADSTDVSFLPPLKHEPLPPKSKARMTAASSASTSSAAEPHRTYAKSPFVPPSEPSSGRSSPSSTHLQELRRNLPHVSSPLSNTPRAKSHSHPPVSASRPGVKLSASTAAVTALRPGPLPAVKALSTGGTPQFRVPASEPELGNKPVAKMLVECCQCKFFHDMPSRVYECMATPDAVVTDRSLGVSGAITTSVKCPWCSHNMSVQCCAGYAALVYLKERLH